MDLNFYVRMNALLVNVWQDRQNIWMDKSVLTRVYRHVNLITISNIKKPYGNIKERK